MNADVARPTSPILPLVDALTVRGDGAPALLVQVEADWAAVAVKPSGILLVVLDARERETWGAVIARAAGVLRTEHPEVIAGLADDVMGVVLVGSAMTAADLQTAPRAAAELGRTVHWIVVDPDRGVFSDGRSGLTSAATAAYKDLDKVVAAALTRAAKGGVQATARGDIERAGEAALAAEARFRGAMQKRHPPATMGILAACVAMFALEYAFDAQSSAFGLVRMGAVSGRLVEAGHYEGLLAYSMLHGSPLHILMNGLALHSLGRMLENLIGGKRFLFVFTLSALGGGIATAVLKPDQLVVGASGGVFGLMTALLGLTLRRGGELPTLARLRLRQALGSTLLFNLGISLLPGISLLGHAGGGAVGFVLGVSGLVSSGVEVPWLPRPEPSRAARMGSVFRALAAACAVALALSVGVALARGRPWALGPGAPKVVRIDGTTFGFTVPEGESLRRETLAKTNIVHVVVGDGQLEPLLVELHAAPLEPHDVAELSTDEGLLAYFKSRKNAVAVVSAQPAVKALHGVRAAIVEGKTKNGGEYARWVFVDQGVLVDAEALLAAGSPDAWRSVFSGVEPRAVGTVSP